MHGPAMAFIPICVSNLWPRATPQILGGWATIAIMSASMSTADGAILATSTVMANNLLRKVGAGQAAVAS